MRGLNISAHTPERQQPGTNASYFALSAVCFNLLNGSRRPAVMLARRPASLLDRVRVTDARASTTIHRIQAAQDRWIAFDYDMKKRIVCAYDSTANEVRYEYDSRGRLSHVTSKDGTERRYGYTERDEMAMISDPGIRIENTYGRDGRCIRQLNYISGSTEPYTFDFVYVVKNGAVVQTASTESDGTWMRYTYGSNGYIESQAWARVGTQPVMSTYERNPVTNAVIAVVVTCFDETGSLTRQASPVRDGNEDLVEWVLLRRNCAGVVNGDDGATGWPQVVGV